jgi:hypothetical protein
MTALETVERDLETLEDVNFTRGKLRMAAALISFTVREASRLVNEPKLTSTDIYVLTKAIIDEADRVMTEEK